MRGPRATRCRSAPRRSSSSSSAATENRPTLDPHDHASYFDVCPDDLGEDTRRDIEDELTNLGFDLEASHHEVAIGQHEIDFRHADALTCADNLSRSAGWSSVAAARNGMHATFMPKPIYGENGSGMHINQSLSRGGQNAFFDPSDELQLSATAYGYIAGLMEHLPALTAICNPTVNSYKRLMPGYEAPVYIAWSPGNRSAAIRMPAKRGHSTRAELRTPDPTANPYLAFAVHARGGPRRHQARAHPPAPGERQHLPPHRRGVGRAGHHGPAAQPRGRARRARGGLGAAQTALGDHIFDAFIAEKRREWAEYREQVHEWEFKQYIDRY